MEQAAKGGINAFELLETVTTINNVTNVDNRKSSHQGQKTFVVKFLVCLPLLGHLKKWYNCPFLTDFLPLKGHEIFEKVSFDPYNFRITRLLARKSEHMKHF